MTITKASYSVLKEDPDRNIVFIVDENGRMSITNDAEAVVEQVNQRFPGRRIVYKDTMGNWDELVHNNGVFIEFAPWSEHLS